MENEIVDIIVIVMGGIMQGFAFAYYYYRKKRHFTDYLFGIIWVLLISCVSFCMLYYGFTDYKENANAELAKRYELEMQKYRSELGVITPPSIGGVPSWHNA